MNDEELMAYVDGELPFDAVRRFEAAMARDTALKARVEKQMALRQQLRAAFDPVLSEDIPAALRNAALNTPVSWRLRLRQWLTLGQRGGAAISVPRFAATAAAALAIGVLVGSTAFETNTVIASSDDAMVAQGTLTNALNIKLASDQTGDVRIGVSFQNKTGEDCRSFTTGGSTGLACHSGDEWKIAALVKSEAESGIYQTAGSAMPDAIRNAIGTMAAGDMFDAARERKERDAGWSH